MDRYALIDKLEQEHELERAEWISLIGGCDEELVAYAGDKAQQIARSIFGNKVYFRGIIEFSNYCRNDCFYCGIRRSNNEVARYRLSKEEVLACCADGYEHGYRTFVLQSGEDGHASDAYLLDLVTTIRADYPDCAITLSLGEKSREAYQALYDAGANRYLLRHETADEAHYQKLHPQEMSWQNRMRCLQDLKEIGFQTGCGIMIGSPFQGPEHLAKDMMFMAAFQPHMVGMGPFIPHHQTPFAAESAGSQQLTLFMLALTRIMMPHVLLPATTALGTVSDEGRQLGVLAGCNVIMPNLSPLSVRKKYLLYDNKVGTSSDAADGVALLKRQMEEIGYEVVVGRGDFQGESK